MVPLGETHGVERGSMSTGIGGSIPRETPGGTEAADRVADVLLLFARSDDPLGVSQHRPVAVAEQGGGAPDPAVAGVPVARPADLRRLGVRARPCGRGARRAGLEPARPPLRGVSDPPAAAGRNPGDHHAVGPGRQPADLSRPVRESAGDQDGGRDRAPLPAPLGRLEPRRSWPTSPSRSSTRRCGSCCRCGPTWTSTPTSPTSRTRGTAAGPPPSTSGRPAPPRSRRRSSTPPATCSAR